LSIPIVSCTRMIDPSDRFNLPSKESITGATVPAGSAKLQGRPHLSPGDPKAGSRGRGCRVPSRG
jgi:hypothetical protein